MRSHALLAGTVAQRHMQEARKTMQAVNWAGARMCSSLECFPKDGQLRYPLNGKGAYPASTGARTCASGIASQRGS